MLRSFRVANHKSIRDEAELLLMPAYDKSRPVVPVAGIFGANASGKSNLLDALAWMQTAVRRSFASWEPGAGVPRRPFKLDEPSRARASAFIVEIDLDGQRFSYGFEVDYKRVRGEWLYHYPHNRRRMIFERTGDGIKLGSTVPDYRTRGELLGRQTRGNALFLSVAAHSDLNEVQPVYQWFRTALLVDDPDDAAAEDALIQRLSADQRDTLVSLIRAADLGITEVTAQESVTFIQGTPHAGQAESETMPWEGPDLVIRRQRASFRHGEAGTALRFDEQSDGTRTWISLVLSALDAIDVGGVLVVDEIDSSLHPQLTQRLVNLFRDPRTNPRSAQLIFTTHDATLLDEDTLSRDEIWFVEKATDTGASRLYPLTDFHPRKNENTSGRYLAGGYGAVPVLTDSAFREALTGVDDAA